MTDNDLCAAHWCCHGNERRYCKQLAHCYFAPVSLTYPNPPDPYKMARLTTVLLLALIAGVAIHGKHDTTSRTVVEFANACSAQS
jgi:hypothetical protein